MTKQTDSNNMENKNLTAVEWLVYELERCGYFMINDHFPITFEQAQKMEMSQIIRTYNDGYQDGLSDTNKETKDISQFDNAKLYFNEIYGKK